MSGDWERDFLKKTTKRHRRNLLQILSVTGRICVLMGLVSGFAYLIYYAHHAPSAESYFRLEQIQYHGVTYLDQETVTSLIRQTFPVNVLNIDLERVRSLVEGEKWVRRAVVRRKLPGRLIIYVDERAPEAVAVLDEHLVVVDREGIVLDDFGPDYQDLDRPIVKGLRNVARENAGQENRLRMQAYLEVIRDLESSKKDHVESISEIDVDNPKRVAVIPTDEPVSIYLGENHFLERYERFLEQKSLYYRLKEKYGLIEYVDVTYDDKIIFHTPETAISG